MSNRRLDYTCGVLLNDASSFYSHKYADTTRMGRVGTNRQQVVTEDHGKASFYIDHPELLQQTSPDSWQVRSERDDTVFYVVHRRSDVNQDCHRCMIRCRYCAVCPHAFICECARNRRGGNSPCKHIHFVQILFGAHSPPPREFVLPSQSITATVIKNVAINADSQPIVDVSSPMELESANEKDAKSGRVHRINVLSKKVDLLRDKLARVKEHFFTSSMSDDKLASLETQLQQASRLVNAISAINSPLPIGRRTSKRKMIRQARSFQELQIAKAKERRQQQRQNVLPLSKKKALSEKRKTKRRQENAEARKELEQLLSHVHANESQQ